MRQRRLAACCRSITLQHMPAQLCTICTCCLLFPRYPALGPPPRPPPPACVRGRVRRGGGGDAALTHTHTPHTHPTHQVVLERNTRNKKKCITTISGLDAFGVKLGEASKLFGKKFASGASVVKNAEGKEHIDVQVRCLA